MYGKVSANRTLFSYNELTIFRVSAMVVETYWRPDFG
jgi:hypothetical protein